MIFRKITLVNFVNISFFFQIKGIVDLCSQLSEEAAVQADS